MSADEAGAARQQDALIGRHRRTLAFSERIQPK
jgi:hypothetical protein